MLALNLVLHPFFHSLVRRSLSVSCLVFQEGSSLFLNCPLLLPYHSAPKIQKDGKYFCENRKSKLPVLFALSPENRGCRCKLNRKSDTVIYGALTDSFLKQNKKKFPMYDFGNISITEYTERTMNRLRLVCIFCQNCVWRLKALGKMLKNSNFTAPCIVFRSLGII